MYGRLSVTVMVPVFAGMLVSSAEAQRWNRAGDGFENGCLFDGIPLTPLSEQEQEAVLFMREEEKLARDVYRAMFDLWNVPAFLRISDAEQRHMDAVGRLIVRYGLEDPVADDSEGAFTNPVLANLYDTLIEAGSASRVEALKAGALIEERDIVDLREALALTDHADLERVFGNLMRASRNHLRTFAALITTADETYEAQYLSQEEFDEIAASSYERGGRCLGPCWNKRSGEFGPYRPDGQHRQRTRYGR